MWEQTLSGLIKALRAKKDQEKLVIQQALSEISKEVKTTDLDLKAGAILKLTYLDMLGYPQLSTYSFNVIECMSSPKFHIKQIGYLAACQSFGPKTEVSMLTTNLVKKDLVSHVSPSRTFFNLSDSDSNLPSTLSLALSSLPHLLTLENSIDFTPELLSMLNHSKKAIRKRAIIVIHSLANLDLTQVIQDEGLANVDPIPQHPEISQRMELWVDRLRPKLLDDDISVVSSTVNVICELALKYPWPWLEVAAELYDLFKTANNNWMMIKIVKLFTALTPIEPRLTRKLLPALSDVISTTNAMSLLYECIHTILAGGLLTYSVSTQESHDLAKICIEKLTQFLTHVDQNLRYIALVGLTKLLGSHPHLLEDYLKIILTLVADPDPSLSSRALDLVEGIKYHSETLQDTVEFLLAHLEGQHPELEDHDTGSSEAVRALMLLQSAGTGERTGSLKSPGEILEHKSRVVNVILVICSDGTYSNIDDFEWFLDILQKLIYFSADLQPTSTIHLRISEAVIDVCSRVADIRPYAVKVMLQFLQDDTFILHVANQQRDRISSSTLGSSHELVGSDSDSATSLITAAVWICGEYSDKESTDLKEVISTLFKRELVVDHSLSMPQVTTACFHNGLKVFAKWLRETVSQWYSQQQPDQYLNKDDDQAPLRGSDSVGVTELVQLKRLISAIVTRVEEVMCLSVEDSGLRGIDQSEMLDRAHEVGGLMGYLSSELENYSPPQPIFKSSRSHAHADDVTDHPSVAFYADVSFGKANPFANSTVGGGEEQRDEMEIHHQSYDLSRDREKTTAESVPFWYTTFINLFFSFELRPVANQAQEMVYPPDELRLDSWIDYLKPLDDHVDQVEVKVDEYGREDGASDLFGLEEVISIKTSKKSKGKKSRKGKGLKLDDLANASQVERLELESEDPYYIGSSSNRLNEEDEIDIDMIPIVKLDLNELDFTSPSLLENEKKKTKTKPSRRKVMKPVMIDCVGEMPEFNEGDHRKQVMVDEQTTRTGNDQIVKIGVDEVRPLDPILGEKLKVVVTKKKKPKKEKETGASTTATTTKKKKKKTDQES